MFGDFCFIFNKGLVQQGLLKTTKTYSISDTSIALSQFTYQASSWVFFGAFTGSSVPEGEQKLWCQTPRPLP